MYSLVAAVLLSLAVLLLGVAVGFALLAASASVRVTAADGVSALPTPADVRVVKAGEALDRLAGSEHVPVRAASSFLRRSLAVAARARSRAGATRGGDSSLGDGLDSLEEEGLQKVLFAVAGLSGLASAPDGEDVSSHVDRLLATLTGTDSASGSRDSFQARSGGIVGSTASGVW